MASSTTQKALRTFKVSKNFQQISDNILEGTPTFLSHKYIGRGNM
jgi:hypothetical protein